MLETALRRTVKVTLYLGVFFFVIFTVMMFLGGKSEGYKTAIEGFIGGLYGGSAEIEIFHGITFFPSLSLKAENIALLDAEEKPAGRVGLVDVKISFWDVLRSNGRLQRFHVKDMALSQEITRRKPLAVTRAAILEQDGEYYFKSEGVWGDDPFELFMEMQRFGSAEAPTFAFGSSRLLSFDIADFQLSVRLEDLSDGVTGIRELRMIEQDTTILSGSGEVRDSFWTPVTITGEFSTALGTQIAPRITLEAAEDGRTAYRGDLTLRAFASGDIGTQGSALRGSLERFVDLLDSPVPGAPLSLPDHDIALNLRVESWQEYHGALTLPVTLRDRALTIDLQGGSFAHGKLLGRVALDASQPGAARLAIDTQIKNANLDAFLTNREGRESATVLLKADGQGARMEDILASLAGEMSLVTADNHMKTGMIDLWGGGLLSAILPDLTEQSDSRLNCVIAHAGIEGGTAIFDTILMDTDRVSVIGKGVYNIADDALDIRLKPESKGLAIGTVNPAVNVRGSLGAPEASASAASLGAKLGGLLLGAVNPAMWALSFADLGLNDGHPCMPFLEEKPQETAP